MFFDLYFSDLSYLEKDRLSFVPEAIIAELELVVMESEFSTVSDTMISMYRWFMSILSNAVVVRVV